MRAKLFLLALASVLFSCGPNHEVGNSGENKKTELKSSSETKVVAAPKINADSIVKSIDAERERIENNLKSLQRKSLSTKGMREQIKQKWSKLDFYTENSQVVRIKSYPYANITKRTEEFYFRNGQLIIAFIEDNGLDFKGKEPKRDGKTYYFAGDSLLRESNMTHEQETTIRSSDSERLLQEAKEYLGLFPR
jgi:hypothetical protein